MKSYHLFIVIFVLLFYSFSTKEKAKKIQYAKYPITGVPFNQVQVNDIFWLPKIETNRMVTIPASFKKCKEMGRMDNFLIAGGKMEGSVKGEMPFDDTDVYKIIDIGITSDEIYNSSAEVWQYKGNSNTDKNATWNKMGKAAVENNLISELELPSTSITVITIK